MKIATAEIPAKASASASRSRFESLLALLVFCPTLAFACWTVACHICVTWHLSFQTLCRVGLPALLCGAVAGGFLARPEGLAEYNNERNSPSAPKRRQFILLIVAAAIVGSLAFGIGYSGFWICAVGLLTYAALQQWNVDLGFGEPPAVLSLSNFGKCVLLLLVIFAPIV